MYQCKAISEKLQTAFGDTSCDDPHIHVHPESMCMCCKLALDSVISAMKNKVHQQECCYYGPCEKHSTQGCKVKGTCH